MSLNTTSQVRDTSTPRSVKDVQETTCCIVGGGPAGAVLALLLARQNIPVTLLEAHADFEREFRGDTIHPSIMEVLDEIGIADRLLELPHTKIRSMTVITPQGPQTAANLSHLKTRFPYITMMPQSRFLTFMTDEAKRYPGFKLIMNATVQELVKESGNVCGVRYQGRDGLHEVRALLTVAADGRFSRIRHLIGATPITTSAPMDVLWLRLPKKPTDPVGGMGRFGSGALLIELDRGDEWQIGYIIRKGSYKQLQAAGIATLQASIAELAPELADRVDLLSDWHKVSLLSVSSDRLPRWYMPGLLLIGDAAHVMSPAGGNGINYAIMDAVATANRLTAPLRAGHIEVADLAAVQRRREVPTRIIQAIVRVIQDRLITRALDPAAILRLPGWLRSPLIQRLPFIKDLPAHVVGFGIRREHVAPALRVAAAVDVST